MAYEASSHDDVDACVDVADAEKVLMPLIIEVFAFFFLTIPMLLVLFLKLFMMLSSIVAAANYIGIFKVMWVKAAINF